MTGELPGGDAISYRRYDTVSPHLADDKLGPIPLGRIRYANDQDSGDPKALHYAPNYVREMLVPLRMVLAATVL